MAGVIIGKGVKMQKQDVPSRFDSNAAESKDAAVLRPWLAPTFARLSLKDALLTVQSTGVDTLKRGS